MVSSSKTTNFDAPHPEWKYLARFLQHKRPPQRKEGQSTQPTQNNTSFQVSPRKTFQGQPQEVDK